MLLARKDVPLTAMKKKIMTVLEMARAGGLARKKALTPEVRSSIAKDAAKTRWKGHIKKGA